MSSKQLTAKVRLDVTQAEKKIKLLEKKIKKLDSVINNQARATSGLSKGFDKAANSANKFNKNVRKSANSVGFLTKKVKMLANAYLGIMGAKAVINTSDIITSAENKLNNIPGGNAQATQQTMDKTYAAAQRSRGDYGEMLSNVSKTMTLAGDAFQNNVDNAIKFQEIMNKAYSVGGASAAEQASSMYQLVQALGSGVLQGDELRSVREGAAYAYQEIEKFAQGIYGADKSLKDLASQGLITSDIVVAAIMNAEESINDAFANTEKTFAQVGISLKNIAIKAFEPVLQRLNDALNSAAGEAIVNGIGRAIIIVANAVNLLFTLIEKVYNFIADNWAVIGKVLASIGAILASVVIPMVLYWFGTTVAAAFGVLISIGKDVAAFLALAKAEGLATVMAELFGITLNWWLLLIIAVIAAVIVAIIWIADSFVDACGIVVGSLYWLWAVFCNIFNWMSNVAMGLWESIKAIGQNIGIAFENAWNSAKSAFWSFIANCLEGLKGLEPAINAVAKAFGAEGFTLSGVIDNVNAKANSYKQKEYVSVGNAWSKGYSTYEYQDLSEAYSKGYNVGSEWGQGAVDKLNELKNKFSLGDGSQYALGGSYDPEKALNGIDANTGKIADSMDLTNEDLEYLRKLADMEWKKEYTTAAITINMDNQNTINNKGDLDGWVISLRDMLEEEISMVANGVYA